MTKGIQIATKDVQGLDIKDEMLDSRALSPKSKIEGEGSVTSDVGGNASVTIPHNLGYTPVHLVYFNPGNVNAVNHPGLFSWIDAMTSSTWGLMDNQAFIVHATDTTLGINIIGVANTTYYYKYFIFVEPAK
jgi:hypothetical protein